MLPKLCRARRFDGFPISSVRWAYYFSHLLGGFSNRVTGAILWHQSICSLLVCASVSSRLDHKSQSFSKLSSVNERAYSIALMRSVSLGGQSAVFRIASSSAVPSVGEKNDA